MIAWQKPLQAIHIIVEELFQVNEGFHIQSSLRDLPGLDSIIAAMYSEFHAIWGSVCL